MPPYGFECSDLRNGTCEDRGAAGGEGFFPTVLAPHDCPLCGGGCCAPWTNPPPKTAAGAATAAATGVGRPARSQQAADADAAAAASQRLFDAVGATLRNTTTNPLWRNPAAWPNSKRGGATDRIGQSLFRPRSCCLSPWLACCSLPHPNH
eukprot:SAG22_NODE_947_length_6367_cov_23.437460_7_plen_151_part_00